MDLVVQIHHLVKQIHAHVQNHARVQNRDQEDGPEEAELQGNKLKKCIKLKNFIHFLHNFHFSVSIIF